MKNCIIKNGYCIGCGKSEGQAALCCFFDDPFWTNTKSKEIVKANADCSNLYSLFDSKYRQEYDKKLPRLGKNFNCSYCEQRTWKLNRDHFWPKSKGGILIVPSCNVCNTIKGDKTPHEFLYFINDVRLADLLKGLRRERREHVLNHATTISYNLVNMINLCNFEGIKDKYKDFTEHIIKLHTV